MYKISKLSLILKLSFYALALGAPQTQAADLMDIFRNARNHSPTWEATKLANEIEEQKVAGTESQLYPQITAGLSTQNITTSGSGVAEINPVYLDEDALTQCIIDTQVKQRSCNPSLIIRDDLGGRFDTYTDKISFTQTLYNYAIRRSYNQSKIQQNTAN